MKKYIFNKLTLAVSLLTLIGYSCKEDFLTVLPTGAIAKSQLTTKKGLEGALIATYGQISGYGTRMVHPNNWVWGRDPPTRPSATSCCCVSSSKTLPIGRGATARPASATAN